MDLNPTDIFHWRQELKNILVVPKLNKFHQSQNRIKKYQLVEAFLSFLLRLLSHKTDPIVNQFKDRIGNLEKELRFLHTILEGILWMPCDDEPEEFKKLLAEFEAVANRAGIVVHSLLFSTDPAYGVILEDAIGAVLNRIDLLKTDIMKFVNLLSSITRSAYTTPKTSVVDSLLIVDSLIDDLEHLLKQEDYWIAGVKDQIETLHKGLTSLQSSVKCIGAGRPSEVGEMKETLMRIGGMAHEAEHLIISFLAGDAPLWYLTYRLTNLNGEIELSGIEIRNKYEFGHSIEVPEHFAAQPSLQHKTDIAVDGITVGLEDKEIHILDLLVGGTQSLQVLTIYGMPGIGKTTLAKKLYNHPAIMYHFDIILWCVVSQAYQRQSLLTDILIHIGFEKDQILEFEEDRLLYYIYQSLCRRRYLIVMDDIWDSTAWNDLGKCFPDDKNGSRILFTTRSKDVAPLNSIIYAMPSLSNDQCWELLEKKVFGIEPCPLELLAIGKKIAAKCYGLPLAVVVIAGILSNMYMEESIWKEVEGNLASHIFDGGDSSSIMQILELSFNHLADHLKPCFLYFGAFEADKGIPARKLMRLWIAEGFVRKEKWRSAEHVAEEYLMELIDKSLVMVAERRAEDGGVKVCVVHDLLRDMCLRRCDEDNFMNFVRPDFCSTFARGHRLQAVHHHCVPVVWRFCQHVRSFHGHHLNSTAFYVRDMRLLRVLYFNCIDAHYIGIEYLVNLRYLVISDLPPSIGSLVNLEYLCVEKNEVVHLPPAIVEMKKLRYIHVGHEAIYAKDCNRSQTNNLEFLSRVVVVDPEDEQILKCSPHLRKLKCTCRPFLSKENEELRFADLGFFTQLESLNVVFYGFDIDITSFSFPSNIRKLALSGASVREMSIIGILQDLEVLKLTSISFEDGRWDTTEGGFENLTFLKLDQIENLTEWNVESSQHFPKLRRLVLRNCPKLEEISSEIGEITTLEMIEVKGRCPKSLVESAKRIQEEQRDVGNEELRVIIGVMNNIFHI